METFKLNTSKFNLLNQSRQNFSANVFLAIITIILLSFIINGFVNSVILETITFSILLQLLAVFLFFDSRSNNRFERLLTFKLMVDDGCIEREMQFYPTIIINKNEINKIIKYSNGFIKISTSDNNKKLLIPPSIENILLLEEMLKSLHSFIYYSNLRYCYMQFIDSVISIKNDFRNDGMDHSLAKLGLLYEFFYLTYFFASTTPLVLVLTGIPLLSLNIWFFLVGPLAIVLLPTRDKYFHEPLFFKILWLLFMLLIIAKLSILLINFKYIHYLTFRPNFD